MDSKSMNKSVSDSQSEDRTGDEVNQCKENNEDSRETNELLDKVTNNKNNQQVIDSSHSDNNALQPNQTNNCNDISDYIKKFKLKISQKTYSYCKRIIQDLNGRGVCVIDNFMEEMGEYILKEVENLYETVEFSGGKIMETDITEGLNEELKIRGDSIYWVNGKEPTTKHITIFMSTLDSIIYKSNRIHNNGLLGFKSISSRTAAMVACYPGKGSGYKRHADNSSSDGRYITCIYYLNKNWNPLTDGGLLRIYPTQVANHEPMNISPEFDRFVCFWSDRRNLHEVMPTNRPRFAITMWYFNDEERKNFKKKKLSE